MRGTVICLALLFFFVGAAQPATPTAHTEKSCASLDQVHDLAQSGDAEAQYWLARQYEAGLCGLCKDDPLAVVWFKKAAAVQGYATAQYNLARSYEKGEGVDKNSEDAFYWYSKAARQGDADAQARLEAF